jgi:hypothetical protein
MVVKFRTLAALALATGIATAHAGEFVYTAPSGWWDLIAPNPPEAGRDMTRIPKDMLTEAMSGKFMAYSADPVENASYPAMFKAVEQPGTVVVTLDEVNKAAAEMIRALAASGIRATIDEYSVFKLNGVPAGMLTIDLGGTGNSRMIRQYLIPGKKTATVLSYSIPKYEYARYLPAIEASARATKGAYDNGGYSFKRGGTAFVVGGLVGALGYVVIVLARRRRAIAAQSEATEGGDAVAAAPGARPAPVAKKAAKYVWNCPACGNPVPLRLEQCRCGAAKPAWTRG